MTKKDYALVADVLRSFGGRTMRPGSLARALADEFQKDNPRFDRHKFLIAAGVSFHARGGLYRGQRL